MWELDISSAKYLSLPPHEMSQWQETHTAPPGQRHEEARTKYMGTLDREDVVLS